MSQNATLRARVARRLAVAAVAAVGLTGALAAPASAASSQGYSTESQCRSAQVAYGASSFVRITKPCYLYTYRPASGVIVWAYRFDYVNRQY